MSWDYTANFKMGGPERVELAVSNGTPSISSDNSVGFSYSSSVAIDHAVGISDATSVGMSFAADFGTSVSSSYTNMIPSFDVDYAVDAPAFQAALKVPGLTGTRERADVYLSSAWYKAAFSEVNLTCLGSPETAAPGWGTARYLFFAADMVVLAMAMVCHGTLQGKGESWPTNDRQGVRQLTITMTAGVPALRLLLGLTKFVYGMWMILIQLDAGRSEVWWDRPGVNIRNTDPSEPGYLAQYRREPKSVRIYCGVDSFIEVSPEKITICSKQIELLNTPPTINSKPSPSPITLQSSDGDVLIDGKTVTVASQSGTTVRGNVTTDSNVTVQKNFTVKGQTTSVQDIAAVNLSAKTGVFG